MTEYIPGDVVFYGDRMCTYLSSDGERARILSSFSDCEESSVVISVDPSEVHKPESLSEKLVCLFYAADAMGLRYKELHFQIKALLDEENK
jgi:hypothetical protein